MYVFPPPKISTISEFVGSGSDRMRADPRNPYGALLGFTNNVYSLMYLDHEDLLLLTIW